MQYSYRIKGMTCQNCVERVNFAIDLLDDASEIEVQLDAPQLKFSSTSEIPLGQLQAQIGKYKIEAMDTEHLNQSEEKVSHFWSTYKPLFIIVFFIAMVSFLAQYPFENFDSRLWMRHFMAGFFIVFSFFKLLNLAGFANSYAMYDVIAKRWNGWGFIYPFVELALGVLYLINLFPFWINVATIVVLGISTIGVVQANLDKRKIQCACLGDVFNLPMSKVTIIEDVSMILMAVLMLWQ